MMRARRVTAVLAGLALIGATLVVSASPAGAAPGG
jgi:hypothetical protein